MKVRCGMSIVIIGGGASGLVAGIASALNTQEKVIILEKEDKVGKKILATGNGRCNYTNRNMSCKNYHSKDLSFVEKVLNAFCLEDTLAFFEQLGIYPFCDDEGRYYPYSKQASAVSDALRNKLRLLNVEIQTGFNLKKISKKNDTFTLFSDTKSIEADKVIMCSGGASGQNLGSDGSGFKILESLGHTINKISPALVQVKTREGFEKSLQGIRSECLVKVNNIEEKGEVQFTAYGLSGIVIMNLSGSINKNDVISLDFFPDLTEEKLCKMLKDRCKNLKGLSLENYFTGLINKKLGNVILKKVGFEKLSSDISQIKDGDIIKIAKLLKSLNFKVDSLMDFSSSQVTKGGVITGEINPKTMESEIVKNLYIAGELIDVYGNCGGYNLQFAWSTGYIAGKNAARS